MFGLKTSELLFPVVLLCIPVIIAQDLFWYMSTAAALTYAGHFIYMKVAVKRINIKSQGVFITGCDSGFGFGLVKHLDKLGFTVFAGCLFKDGDGANTLRASTTGRMHVIELDVTKDDSVNKAVRYVSNKVTETGLLAIVNNAGIQGYGEVEFCTMNIYHTLAEVNLFGMVRTTQAFLTIIRKYKGRIINVTSIHGRFMVPFHAAYGITKFVAETFSDIIRLEMRKFGVKVIIVQPGHFAGITRIVRNENLSMIKAQHDAMWEAANEEVKNTYGTEYYDVLYKSVDDCRPYGRPTIEPVIESLEDAITNENPDYRYLVDGASAMIDIVCILARLNNYLPTGVMDYFCERTYLSHSPKIRSYGMKMQAFGFRNPELLFLGVLLCIPVIIAKDWFIFLSTVVILSYAGYYIYNKITTKQTKIKGQGVFITGCDSGFGFSLAKHLDKLGFTVFAGCLFKDGDGANTLRASTTGRMHVIELDVTKDDSVSNVVSYVSRKVTEKGLLAIVNNAGIQVLGEIEFCTIDIYQKVAEVNLFGLVRTTKAFLPLIREHKGRIINVTSAQGRIGLPFNAAYGITKFGAETFSDILRLEMRKFGVKVIIIEPGNFGRSTGIVRQENLSRIKSQNDAMWEAASEDVKNTYGREYYDVLYKSVEGVHNKPYYGLTLDTLMEAFVDAITNENPQHRYLVDGNNAWIDIDCVLARLNSYLPTGVMDYLRERAFLSNRPNLRSLQT